MWIAQLKRMRWLLLLFAYSLSAFATSGIMSLDTTNMPLSEAIRLTAKFLQQNVMISTRVQGNVSLHISNENAKRTFDLLLLTHGLAKWPIGNTWWIAPQEEIINYQQKKKQFVDMTDDLSSLQTAFIQIRYANAQEIANFFQNPPVSLLSKYGRVRVDARTNILCIQDLPWRINDVRRWIKKLDIPIRQIVIEARIVSVDSDFEEELGVNFLTKQLPIKTDETNVIKHDSGSYHLPIVKLADRSILDVKLNLLQREGHAELVSSPRLFTANQQTAFIEAGEELPYQEVSESGGTALAFKKAVLALKVTPHILPNQKMMLQLQINQDRPNTRLVQGVPTISTRQIATNVLVGSGETIVLGGIYETTMENAQHKTPLIGQIPILGWLFKQKHARENKRELLIFVTPTIML